jgi:stearoyl-CoA desaturase (delta-9 desaturase)
MEYFLTLCGTLALEGGPIAWVATHRIHHQNTDKEGDPHSPQDGGLWAHMGWIITGKAMHQNTGELLPYVPDLRKHKFHMWITTYHWVPSVVLAVILAATLGWKVMMVAMFLRAVLGLHSTWLVNSATHMWGSRRFITTDTSTNSFWVAIFTFGEGWHNNHHAAPQAARHGLAWYEIDMNWYGIAVLRALGLAWDIKFNTLTPNAHLAHSEAAVAPELVLAAGAEPEPEAVAGGD